MLNISPVEIKRARQEALDALTKAYGPQHETPDGKFCWPGRIDRAFALLQKAKAEEAEKTRKAVLKLREFGEKEMAWAEKKNLDYLDLCEKVGLEPEQIDVECTCAFCKRYQASNPPIHGPE